MAARDTIKALVKRGIPEEVATLLQCSRGTLS